VLPHVLGDWGSGVQISPLRPIKIKSLVIFAFRAILGAERGRNGPIVARYAGGKLVTKDTDFARGSPPDHSGPLSVARIGVGWPSLGSHGWHLPAEGRTVRFLDCEIGNRPVSTSK
jgi:hypothetical protein